MPTKLIIRNSQAPGDIVVLSAAVRDLALAHPDRYSVDMWVSKGAEHIYRHNPHVVSASGDIKPSGHGAVMYKAEYPLIKSCNQQRKHFILGFIEHINATLGTKVKLTEFRPSIYMSDEEKATRSFEDPYWVFLSGGKTDFPTKIWAQSHWQKVIDATRQNVNWVQCGGGSGNHIYHMPKNGIYANLIGKTDCRDFLRLIYHSEGVVCVSTMAMHVAAAFNKPCVVIEGGREPWWWEAYNLETRALNMRIFDPKWAPPANDSFVPHKFLHTIGQLPCCKSHGCWRKRVTGRGSVCTSTVTIDGQVVPKCKAMVSPEMVIEAVNGYIADGLARKPTQVTSNITPYSTMKVPTSASVQPQPKSQPKPQPQSKPQPQPKSQPKPKPKPAPAPTPVPAQVVDPETRRDVCVCLYGDTVGVEDETAVRIKSSTPRHVALQDLAKHDWEWLVWIEPSAKLHATWLNKLRALMTTPSVIGRAHRTRSGLLYPCPTFFAVHRSLLKPANNFSGAFLAAPIQYQRIGDAAQLPATDALIGG